MNNIFNLKSLMLTKLILLSMTYDVFACQIPDEEKSGSAFQSASLAVSDTDLEEVNTTNSSSEPSMASKIIDKALEVAQRKAQKAAENTAIDFVRTVPYAGPLVGAAYDIRNFYEEDPRNRENTIGRKVGDMAVGMSEYIPGLKAAGQYFKSEDSESLTEDLLCRLTTFGHLQAPVSTVDAVGKVTGQSAKLAVENYLPGEKLITKATGGIAKNLFGTDTLTEGILGSTYNLFYGNPFSKDSTELDDYHDELEASSEKLQNNDENLEN